jgi:hypothetical protein
MAEFCGFIRSECVRNPFGMRLHSFGGAFAAGGNLDFLAARRRTGFPSPAQALTLANGR